jgi:hypothetical protein
MTNFWFQKILREFFRRCEINRASAQMIKAFHVETNARHGVCGEHPIETVLALKSCKDKRYSSFWNYNTRENSLLNESQFYVVRAKWI